MNHSIRRLLLFVALFAGTPCLRAAWTFTPLSNATDGSLASRRVLGAERTLVASRSGTGLAVASSTGGALVTETIEANANPSNIFVSVGTRGAGLVSYWNGTRYRFALQVDPGTGNGGPSSNWRCGNVPLLPGATGLLPDKIVGQADALLNAYFLVKARAMEFTTWCGALAEPGQRHRMWRLAR